jgi:tripartite-type tricarboxylate transporter receptor subunit TctC
MVTVTHVIRNAAPENPTIAESGPPGYEVTSWYGLSAPANTPRAIIERLHGEAVRVLNHAELKERMLGLGADPVGNTLEQYAAFIQSGIDKWAKVIKAAGIKSE